MITEKAPGKLYIAGEYAVVEPGHTAMIVALDQFVTATITDSSADTGSIISKQYQNEVLSWRRQGTKMIVDERDNPYHYIISGINIIEEYASHFNIKLDTYNLMINSDLDNDAGKKYGLGSSAAVTVATIKAVAKYYSITLTKDLLFKLAAIAHFDVQGNGSLGDVAASVYGGWIAYQSFDRNWLTAVRRTKTLSEILAADWPKLKIEVLPEPQNLKLLIGWTGSPASTSKLVDEVTSNRAEADNLYQKFLKASEKCLQQLIAGFKEANLNDIKQQIRVNRTLLTRLSSFSGVQVENPTLTKLADLADQYGIAAKSSGAGGGDCGIAIANVNDKVDQLLANWRDNDIIPLQLNVHNITELD